MFQDGGVSVDDRFARFGAKSFAINKINSVEVRRTTKHGGKGYIAFWAIAVMFAGTAFSVKDMTFNLVLAAICLGFGYLSWTKRHDVHTYRLFLVTSSAEAQAFETNDQRQIFELRQAIEEAMAKSS